VWEGGLAARGALRGEREGAGGDLAAPDGRETRVTLHPAARIHGLRARIRVHPAFRVTAALHLHVTLNPSSRGQSGTPSSQLLHSACSSSD
jgi:hypothetical protein